MNGKKLKFAVVAVLALACSIPLQLRAQSGVDTASQELKLTGKENHEIALDKAVKYIHNYKSKRTAPEIDGGFLSKDIFQKILSQKGCIGLRYYYAKTDSGASTIVLVGVDSTGNDIVPGVLAEEIKPCPPFCYGPSLLGQ